MNRLRFINISLIIFCIISAYASFGHASPGHFDEDHQIDEYDEKIDDIFDDANDSFEGVDMNNVEAACSNIVCVPFFLCNDGQIVMNGTDTFEWRMSGRKTYPSTTKVIICDDMEMPCCADNVHAALLNSVNEPNDIAEFVDSDDGDQHRVVEMRATIGRCGYQFHQYSYVKQNNKLIARAVQGEDTELKEFPWMVGIFKRMKSGKLLYLGGGSIIHSSIVLTAAHYLQNIRSEVLVVRAGIHDILKTPKDSDTLHQQRNVSRVIFHNELYVRELVNDIALLVVDKPLHWSPYVNPICLPPQNMQTSDAAFCMACGWGKDAIGQAGSYQRELKKISLPLVEAKKCQRLLRNTRMGPYFRMHKSLMCAGGSGADTCKGDGGSPLVCQMPFNKNRFYQTGIVAGGVGCGGRMPALYVNVANFVDWIANTLWNMNMRIDKEDHLMPESF